jgi:hypothetical protein
MADYTTKTKISQLTGIAEVDIQADWLAWATDEIDTASGESFFAAASETLKIDGPGGNTLMLPKYPILTITKIECDGVEWTGADITNSFAIYEEEGMIKVREGINYDNVGLDEVFAKGTQNIEITGTFGYASVPKLVEELATLIVIRIMREKSLGMTDEITEERIGDYSVKYRENKYDLIQAIEDLFGLIVGDDPVGEAV